MAICLYNRRGISSPHIKLIFDYAGLLRNDIDLEELMIYSSPTQSREIQNKSPDKYLTCGEDSWDNYTFTRCNIS